MRRVVTALALLALFSAGCASISERAEEVPAKDAGAGLVELRPSGNRTFLWQSRAYSLQELNSALVARDQTQPVERINLLDGEQSTTVADVIDIAVMAKTLGASPFLQKDGQLQPITLEITE
jgi:hypothetical protein